MRIGSIVAARHAGTSTAQQPTTASAIIEEVRETGLHRLLSVQAAIGRWSIATSANPPPISSAIVIIEDVKMSPRMRAFDAPNAMRRANSRVRSETAHATTLYMPTGARREPTPHTLRTETRRTADEPTRFPKAFLRDSRNP